MYYAILIVGNRKKVYTIRQVFQNRMTLPTDLKTYKTLEKALQVAYENNWNIEKIGDVYEILP